jgi:alpha-glucosidase (family GH31 glycosyl hydrolase)
VDFFSGEHFSGPTWRNFTVPIERIPLYAKAGAIIPMRNSLSREDGSNPTELDLIVFPGADGRFELYEDDNTSQAYREGALCTTLFEQTTHDGVTTLKIHAAEGDLRLLPEERRYTIHLRGVKNLDGLQAKVAGTENLLPVVRSDASEVVLKALSLRPDETAELAFKLQNT